MSDSPFSKILLVGHCASDSHSLTVLAQKTMGLPTQRVNDQTAFEEALEQYPHALLWVNRVFVGPFDAHDGLELIAKLAQRSPKPAMMLITNYGDIQAQAVAAGALEGFGKNDLRSPEVLQRLTHLATGSSSQAKV